MKPIIEAMYTDMQTHFEDEVMTAVRKVGINVDKDRLLTALIDARAFYNEGYQEGLADSAAHGEWKSVFAPNDGFQVRFWECSVCGKWRGVEYNFCPNCGAKMDGDANA